LSAMVTIANVGLETACDAYGVTIACGVISEALAQIRQAIMTGTNDWAECTGVAEIAREFGRASEEYSTGISDKQFESPWWKAFNFDGTSYSICCHCARRYYMSKFGTDEAFRTDGILQYTVARE